MRRHLDPEGAAKIEEYVDKIRDLLEVKVPFHIVSDFAKDVTCNFEIRPLLFETFVTVNDNFSVGKTAYHFGVSHLIRGRAGKRIWSTPAPEFVRTHSPHI